MKKEETPTKEQMWEQIVKLTDEVIHNAWNAGFYAGRYEAVNNLDEIVIEDIDE